MDRQQLISPDGLEKRLGDKNLSIICNFMTMPGDSRDGAKEFSAERIPGAVYFDIDAVADQSSTLPHMVASPEQFSRQMGELGISHSDDIVIYDRPGLFSSARVWWNLKIMGANNVRILEGGFDRWKRENRPTDKSAPTVPQPAQFHAQFDAERVVDVEQMLAFVGNKQAIILDARSAARYEGSGEEPRPGLRLGHMPGAVCLPFVDLVEDGTLIDNNRLLEKIKPLLANDELIITTCGSGVTAAVISLALSELGIEGHALYDGSWTEWGDPDRDYPISTGMAATQGSS